MGIRDTTPSAARNKARHVIMDALWVMSFMTTWGLLITFWDTWWAIVLVPLFSVFLAGLSEALHQTVHLNLFGRSRKWNGLVGKFAGALVSIDFDTYRAFHLKHHQTANSPADPERQFYNDPAYVELAKTWRGLSTKKKVRLAFRLSGMLAQAVATIVGNAPFVRVVGWAVPLVIAGLGYLEGLFFLIPVKVFIAWYLPRLLFLFMDLLFAQSEHYGTSMVEGAGPHSTVSYKVQYENSWNLKLPAIIEYLVISRNLHAEHHLKPSIHWSQARTQKSERTLPLGKYMSMLWKEGPRT